MRPPGWGARLRWWAARRLGNPFEWGRTDCALVCLEALDAMRMSGTLAAQYRGRYSSQRAALKFQRAQRIDLAVALERAGVFRVTDAPRVGDILIHPHPALPFMVGHVCLGAEVVSAREPDGVGLGLVADALRMPGAGVWREA